MSQTDARPTTGDELYLDLLKKCLSASIYPESAWKIVESPRVQDVSLGRPVKSARRVLKHWRARLLARHDKVIVKRKPFDPDVRDVGEDWPMFGYTMIGLKRLNNIQTCIKRVLAEEVPGDLIETGVWRGGATIFMRAVLKAQGVTDRVVWAADSFEGLPKPDTDAYGDMAGDDLSECDYLKVSLEDVKENFARFGLLDDQVQFLKGWFRDTLPNAPIDKLAILRLDGDLYESTIDALKALYDRVSPGGFVIVDDYYSWPSCKQAVTDFRAERGIISELIPIDNSAVYWRAIEAQEQSPR